MIDSSSVQTTRLYYTDARLTAFDARVIALRQESAVQRASVALDCSAFYPTSGGQPHDTGTLGGVRVVDVTADDGIVWHWLDGEPPWSMQQVVEGEVDWARRFDHMQQHSAQHLLSQLFARLFEAETLSVHFGPEESTLDLDAPALDAARIEAAEAEATAIVYAALPIRVYSVDEEGVARLPLRKPPTVQGNIRIVEIAGFDWSACGGTHCATTAEAGPIKIVRTERRKGGVRVTFLAGGRAVADYQRKHTLLTAAAALFSTDVAQVPDLIERQMALSKEQAHRIDDLTNRLLRHEAAALLQATARTATGPLIVRAMLDDLDGAALRLLVNNLITQADEPGGVVALLASRSAGGLLLAFGCTPGLPVHLGKLLGETLALAGGKGGGRPDFAQGGGVTAAVGDQLLDFAAERLHQAK